MAHMERVLIVGGGIAGLTVATALHRQGFRAELVERSTLWQATGAAIQLHANATRILHALGLGEAVEQAGAVIRRWIYCDQDGEVLCDLDLQVQECLAAISSDEQTYCGPVEGVELDHWHRGRVVLIGDAAHSSAPTMGQGGCMAMEDAYVLADILRRAETLESALDSYETRRKPRATWVQQQSRGVLESFLMPSSQRNPAFRERGNQTMRDSFAPLIPEP